LRVPSSSLRILIARNPDLLLQSPFSELLDLLR
jgi:hypothetical protein